jgi:hypothetical protein
MNRDTKRNPDHVTFKRRADRKWSRNAKQAFLLSGL